MQKDKVQQFLSYTDYVANYKRRIQFRKQNFSQHHEDIFGGQRKLSQIKLIQKFIGKFKSEHKNIQTLLIQLNSLNLSKYIEQISSIIATSINQKQINFYTEVATKLNTSYQSVPAIMIKDLIKVFNQYLESQQDNKYKIKSLFLFTLELFVCGFSFSYKQIIDMLKKIFKSGKNKKLYLLSQLQSKLFLYYYSCPIFSDTLIHFSQILTKRIPQWIQSWEKQGKQIFKYPQTIPIKTKQQLTNFFTKYISQCHLLLKQIIQVTHSLIKLLKNYQLQLFQCLRLNGQFSKQLQKKYTQLVQRFTTTKKYLKILSMSLNQPLNLKQLDIKIITIQQIMTRYIDKAQNSVIFEDQFQRQIYQTIPDLVVTQDKNVTEEQYKDFKLLLDNCKNVSDSNAIAKSFSSINNKRTRKLLAKDSLQYRKQYHLVTPYLCRVVAIINLHYKDIGQLVNDLIFAEYQKLKDAITNNFVINDKKSRIMKYICQFTKLKVIETQKTLNCIENLIDNLNGYNIQLIISVLENVGRFLHLSQNSGNRFTFLLKKYQNIIKKKSLPILTTSQLINSINLLKPKKQLQKSQQHIKSIQQQQAQNIMSFCIINQINKLINQINQLIKTQKGFNAIKSQFLKKIQHFDFMNNYNYAYLLQQLNNPNLTKFIVQRTIQNLMLYLSSGSNQKTILWSKFLGQLYKYHLLQRNTLFLTIQNTYKILNNQIGIIHIFCHILQACIGYLDCKKVIKKNEKFLLFYHFKIFLNKCKYIPMEQQFEIIDIFDQYSPNLIQIDLNVLSEFIQYVDNKMKNQNKQLAYDDELSKYLSSKNIKKHPLEKDRRIQPHNSQKSPTTQQQKPLPQKPLYIQKSPHSQKPQDLQSPNLIQQSKFFQQQLMTIMQQNRKDYSSRISKPILIQKILDKRKQKKKDGPFITIIGRSGNKFIIKDIPKNQDKIAN